MCPTNGVVKPGTTTSHVCVDLTCIPSGRLIVSGVVAEGVYLGPVYLL